jgi:hypothetical protein
MRRSFAARFSAIVGAVLVAASTVCAGGLDVDFGAEFHLGDDREMYFALAGHYYGRGGDEIRRVDRRLGHPDDVAVAFFLARRCEAGIDVVLDLRRQGLDWWQIGIRLGVSPDVWFVPVEREPGPPYGRAYGHWRNRKHGGHGERWRLSDEDTRNLVAVRILHEYYGVDVETAMRWRSDGTDLSTLMAREYRERHGRRHESDRSRSDASDGRHGKSDKGGKGRGRDKSGPPR